MFQWRYPAVNAVDGNQPLLPLKNSTLVAQLGTGGSTGVFHAFRFDCKTGQPRGGDNYCGRGAKF